MTLIPSELVKAVRKVPLSMEFQKFEGRLSHYGALNAFIENTGMLVPKASLEEARSAARRPVEIPVLNAYDATLLTERACSDTPDSVTSAMVPLSWTTTGFVIEEFPDEVYAGNYFTKQEHFDHQLKQGLRAAFADLDSAAVAYLEAEKSATNASPLFGALVADAKQVEYEERSNFYKSIQSIMVRNDLPDMNVLDVTTPEAQIEYLFTGAQGSQNGTNTAYQVAPVIPYRSNRVLNGAGVFETHYLTPQGSIGMLTWNSVAARNGSRIHENDRFFTMPDPLYNITWDVKLSTNCVDVSGTYAGVTAGVQKIYAFTVDYAFMRPYSSDANYTPIFKYEILADPETT